MRRYYEGFAVAAAAGATTSAQYTVPQERGNVVGVRIVADNNTVGDQTKVLVTMDENGNEVMKSVPLADVNESFLLERFTTPIQSAPGGVIGIRVVSTAAGTVNLNFVFIMEK